MKIKIGNFARIGQVTVQTLRHYDDLGLLKPSEVDALSGYRYYTLEQLPRLHRILALKDLGFSLEQIARLLEEDLPPAELRGMLRLKQDEPANIASARDLGLATVQFHSSRQLERDLHLLGLLKETYP